MTTPQQVSALAEERSVTELTVFLLAWQDFYRQRLEGVTDRIEFDFSRFCARGHVPIYVSNFIRKQEAL